MSAEAESGTPPFEPLNPTADPSALDSLYRAYTPYLRAIVRRNLSDRLQGKFDSMDVVHSVWARVARQLGEDGWRVENEEQLRGLLATIARRRVASRARRPEALGELPDGDWERLPEERRSRPSEVAQANELWERMLTLCPPEHRAILELRRQGLLLEEIAERIGLHEGSVRRVLRQLARDLALDNRPLPRDRHDTGRGT
ncbi:MAG TPA: sigma-70 family RNA polymerase sigma factor [Gemmataceae bacterium]